MARRKGKNGERYFISDDHTFAIGTLLLSEKITTASSEKKRGAAEVVHVVCRFIFYKLWGDQRTIQPKVVHGGISATWCYSSTTEVPGTAYDKNKVSRHPQQLLC